MLTSAKKAVRSLFKRSDDLTPADVADARRYIREYWGNLIRHNTEDNGSLIGVPHPYLVPSYAAGHEFDYDELFYWDSYFMVQCMMDDDHKELVIGILDDLIYIFNRFKVIPNSSHLYMISRSQPPFLTSFIFDVYDAYKLDGNWLKSRIETAKQEYATVWMGTRKPNARQVYQGLSRYYDFNYLHDIAEAESGWDMTTRFNRKALDYVPVDLNALLYKYEMDFARAARIFGDKREAATWEVAAQHRKKTMDKLMWSNLRGLYYDYNYTKERRGGVSSLASFYALWAGMVDDKQAAQMVKALRRFEVKGGLTTTDAPAMNHLIPGAMPTQWAYPNGWAPLHFLVVEGLKRYGYHEDAERIARKWIKTNLDWFHRHGVFLEKYNVVQPDKPPAKGLYPGQEGFGWTNAVFERFCADFITPYEQPPEP